MTIGSIKVHHLLLPLGGIALGVSLMTAPIQLHATSQQGAGDNTSQNKEASPNADQQGMNPSDRAMTRKIRKAIHEDKSLSTYAHNIKIITRNGAVTLEGPVRSEDEKNNLQAKAAAVAGQSNVINNLEVAPAK